MCHKLPWQCSVCHNHYLIRSSFMTCHQICNKCTTPGATTYSSWAHELNAFLCGVRVPYSSVSCVMFCRPLLVCFSFLTIVFTICELQLLATSFFGIFKHFRFRIGSWWPIIRQSPYRSYTFFLVAIKPSSIDPSHMIYFCSFQLIYCSIDIKQ
jgi:hypothetical protein